MKKGMIKSILGIGLSLCLMAATCANEEGGNQKNDTQKKALVNKSCINIIEAEHDIYFEDLSNPHNIYSFNLSDLNFAKDSFRNHFKYCSNRLTSDTSELISEKMTISFEILKELSDSCKKIPGYQANDKCFASLRMHYAIESNKMIILFEPIYLKDSANHYYIKAMNSPLYWSAINNSFEPKSFYQDKIDAYQSPDTGVSKIYIVHRQQNDVANSLFINDSSDAYRGDTKSCILPIQQIVRVYCENGHNETNTTSINFSIVANSFYKFSDNPPASPKNLKLHIVAYLDNIGENNFEDSYKFLGADFGQMDPPGRIFVNYPSNKNKKN